MYNDLLAISSVFNWIFCILSDDFEFFHDFCRFFFSLTLTAIEGLFSSIYVFPTKSNQFFQIFLHFLEFSTDAPQFLLKKFLNLHIFFHNFLNLFIFFHNFLHLHILPNFPSFFPYSFVQFNESLYRSIITYSTSYSLDMMDRMVHYFGRYFSFFLLTWPLSSNKTINFVATFPTTFYSIQHLKKEKTNIPSLNPYCSHTACVRESRTAKNERPYLM